MSGIRRTFKVVIDTSDTKLLKADDLISLDDLMRAIEVDTKTRLLGAVVVSVTFQKAENI